VETVIDAPFEPSLPVGVRERPDRRHRRVRPCGN